MDKKKKKAESAQTPKKHVQRAIKANATTYEIDIA